MERVDLMIGIEDMLTNLRAIQDIVQQHIEMESGDVKGYLVNFRKFLELEIYYLADLIDER